MRSAVVFLVIVIESAGNAQVISAGVKAGVPLTHSIKTAGDIGGIPYTASTNRFTVGPVINLHLPKHFGLEFGAMYKRFEQKAGQIQVNTPGGGPLEVISLPIAQTGESWDFPILGRYILPSETVRPFVESGICFNHLSSVLAPFRTTYTQGLYSYSKSEKRMGFVLGGRSSNARGTDANLTRAALDPIWESADMAAQRECDRLARRLHVLNTREE